MLLESIDFFRFVFKITALHVPSSAEANWLPEKCSTSQAFNAEIKVRSYFQPLKPTISLPVRAFIAREICAIDKLDEQRRAELIVKHFALNDRLCSIKMSSENNCINFFGRTTVEAHNAQKINWFNLADHYSNFWASVFDSFLTSDRLKGLFNNSNPAHNMKGNEFSAAWIDDRDQ